MQPEEKSDKTMLAVRCPACGSVAPYEGNPFRPFCSRTCKGSDLLNWSRGVYQIPGESSTAEDDHE